MVAHVVEPFVGPMSPRARAYLWATSIPNLVTGLFCFFGTSILHTPSYSVIHSVLPFQAWGALFLLVSVLSAYAAIRCHEGIARWALTLSATSCAFWASGFAIAYFSGHLAGPTGTVVWGALAVKDLIVCRQPLRSPFEAIARALGQG